MSKRITSLITALLIVLLMTPAGIFARTVTDSETAVSFTADNVTAAPGAECDVSIYIQGEYLAHGLTMIVDFDPDLLTVESLTPGPVCMAISAALGMVTTDLTGTPGKAKFTALLPSDAVSEQGCLFTLRFKVADNAAVGAVSPITIDVHQFYYMPVGEFISTPIDFTAVNGSVTVALSGLPGDVDCDGAVGETDISLLVSYLLDYDPEISEQGLANADANGDGSIDTLDPAAIWSIIIGG